MLLLRKPWYRKMPYFIRQIHFDLIVFYVDLLNIQWPPYSIEKFIAQAGFLKEMKAVKIALMQDEFYHTDALDGFIKEYEINYVCTLAPESEWRKIYPNVDAEKVKFKRILPGYLDDQRIKEIEHLNRTVRNRPITIGYRAIKQQNMQWLGRHGFKKIEIAQLFQEMSAAGCDISTRAEDALLGNQWYEFLLGSKYTIAIEGGATVLDHDGNVRKRTEAYLAQHPQARFEEIEQVCFPGRDGELNYMSISPKHLEACATKTCQILVEGDYNGILTPGVHYIELKRDFSNIDQVLSAVQEDRLRSRITERAYTDIVESGAYSYRTFVHWVLGLVLLDSSRSRSYGIGDQLIYALGRIYEINQWIILALMSSALRMSRRFLPDSFETFLRKLFA
jgi:hypothetical protein